MRVRPGRLILAAACCAAMTALPASVAQATSTGGALSTGPSAVSGGTDPSSAMLIAVPARPTVGQTVRLSVASPPPGVGGVSWDLSGRGVYRRKTGAAPRIDTVFDTPGIHAVEVRFTVAGQTRLGVLTVSVAPRPASRPRARASHATRAHPAPQAHAHGHGRTAGLSGRVTAHVAGDPGVTVADFHFSPATTTVHVGDTITWTNNGPSSHTATAHNGTFDTGVLKKGQTASHTFTQPGTITYFCQIHPFMHGTIVVEAATAATTSGSATTPTATTPTATTPTATTAGAGAPGAAAPTTAAQTGPTLPNTGFNVAAAVCAGLLLLGLGVALRYTRPGGA